jgi:hypothetical protein
MTGYYAYAAKAETIYRLKAVDIRTSHVIPVARAERVEVLRSCKIIEKTF